MEAPMLKTMIAAARAQWMGALALFLVLTGGTAYALDGSNTVFTDDIVNGDVKVADIGQGAVATDELANGQVKAADLGDSEVTTAEIANGQVKTADIGDSEIRTADVAADNLTGGDIAGNSLKGADIDEGTLDIGDAARAYAYVDHNSCTGTPGTCTPQQSKGISSIIRVDTGQYCVIAPGINSNVTPAAVTVDWSSTFDPEGNASAMTYENFNCGPSGQGFGVVTERQPEILVDQGGGTDNAEASGPADVANLVGFTIVIP